MNLLPYIFAIGISLHLITLFPENVGVVFPNGGFILDDSNSSAHFCSAFKSVSEFSLSVLVGIFLLRINSLGVDYTLYDRGIGDLVLDQCTLP